MKLIYLVTILITIPAATHAATVNENVDRSRAAIQKLGHGLKEGLQSAMKSGGAVTAVSECNVLAPGLTQEAQGTDIKVKRTSLKVRNPNNEPDEWERQVLLQFRERIAAGEKAEGLEHFDIIDDSFRYMKPIMTGGLCITCHGATIALDVQAVLAQKYPHDQATGFSIGDVRGAFSVTISGVPEVPDEPETPLE